jgi:hypothetical protein
MDNPNQVTRAKFRCRTLLILVSLIILSISCDEINCVLGNENCIGDDTVPTPTINPVLVKTYYATGQADTTYVVAYGPPKLITNKCHDEISEAIMKVCYTQTVPENLGITQKLTTDQVYFTAEIHSALSSSWRNKQYVYAENKDEYELVQLNGIYNTKTGDMFPVYTSDTACPNAAQFVWGGSGIQLTYDCKKGPTTNHYYFVMQMQNP